MPQLNLFIDTTTGNLVSSQTSSQIVAPGSLPLNYGDTLAMQVYLLTRIANPSGPGTVLSGISTAGISLQMYLTDAVNATTYTQQITWTTDANNSYFIGTLALNTAQLLTLLGGGGSPTLASAQAKLKVNYVANGLPTTVLNQTVTIAVGSPSASTSVPAGLTPLSVEVANSLYVPKQAVAGQGIYLMSPAGKTFLLQAIDNADGTATVVWPEVN